MALAISHKNRESAKCRSLNATRLPAVDEAAPVVEIEGLGRRFGGRWAVVDVNLTLRPGECLAIFGPNGAGKTTLLRILAGLLEPTTGRVRIAGVTLPGGTAARAAVGLISHHSMLYPMLTARENVGFAARLYSVPDPDTAADAALDRMRVLDRADTPVRQLSRGLQQRVSIARAFVHTPRVVLLDEPYTGLDVVGAAVLSEALAELARAGAALVLVTHSLDEGLGLATRTAVMRAGRLVRVDERVGLDAAEFGAWYRASAQ
jgi:heme exporter protein A